MCVKQLFAGNPAALLESDSLSTSSSQGGKGAARLDTGVVKMEKTIARILAAIGEWQHCDWAHERESLDGVTRRDAEQNPVECEGGSPRSCGYCHDARKDALQAARCARAAIVAAKKNDLPACAQWLARAASIEKEYGDSPAYGAVAAEVEAMLEVKTA